jgi:hypothetical protein
MLAASLRRAAADGSQQSAGERRLSRALDFLFPIGERDPPAGAKEGTQLEWGYSTVLMMPCRFPTG